MNFNKVFKTGAKIWLLFACKPVIAQDSQIFDIYDCIARWCPALPNGFAEASGDGFQKTKIELYPPPVPVRDA
jgi:hypothetical protein